jgi:hypothetical protein
MGRLSICSAKRYAKAVVYRLRRTKAGNKPPKILKTGFKER